MIPSSRAGREGVLINQLISSAVAEKLSALMTEEYLNDRARHANAETFDAVLAKIPAGPPVQGDELPDDDKKPRRARKTG